METTTETKKVPNISAMTEKMAALSKGKAKTTTSIGSIPSSTKDDLSVLDRSKRKTATSTYINDVDKLEKMLSDSSRSLSVDIIRFVALALSSEIEKVKAHGIWSMALYDTDESSKLLKEKLYDTYVMYTNPDFICTWINNINYKLGHYNIKLVIDKFEEFLETSLIKLGAIGVDNKNINREIYDKVYSKSRLYFHEIDIAKQYKDGQIEVFKNNGNDYKKIKNPFIDEKRAANTVIDPTVDTHVRFTVEKIEAIYEKALGIRFVDSLFKMKVS